MLPVSDPPKTQDADNKLFKGSAMTKRGAFAAVSYMSCAGNLSSSLSYAKFFHRQIFNFQLLNKLAVSSFFLCSSVGDVQ